jgi:hypothetical protein
MAATTTTTAIIAVAAISPAMEQPPAVATVSPAVAAYIATAVIGPVATPAVATPIEQSTMATVSGKQPAAATMARGRFIVIPHQADGEDHKKDRDSSHESAIHLSFLQIRCVCPAAERYSLSTRLRRRQKIG